MDQPSSSSAAPKGETAGGSGSGSLEARREYAQLLRIQDRARQQLERTRDELASPGVAKLLKEVRRRTGTTPGSGLTGVTQAIEDAIRVIQVAESDTNEAMRTGDDMLEVSGIENLPSRLARFLAERDELPGFSYEVTQDDVRGWMILWKEYTSDGRVRGYGQFYERPYAWLDD